LNMTIVALLCFMAGAIGVEYATSEPEQIRVEYNITVRTLDALAIEVRVIGFYVGEDTSSERYNAEWRTKELTRQFFAETMYHNLSERLASLKNILDDNIVLRVDSVSYSCDYEFCD